MSPLTRRTLLKSGVAAGAGAALPLAVTAQAVADPGAPAEIRWLDGRPPGEPVGVTWGVPWPKGRIQPGQSFGLRTSGGVEVPVQSWPIGYWPDGSLKWSAHAVPAGAPAAERYRLAPGPAAAPASAVTVTRRYGKIVVDTGVLRCVLNTDGKVLIDEVARGGRVTARTGELVCVRQNETGELDGGVPRQERYSGEVHRVTVEQSGPVRAVVRIEGKHRAERGGREWLPFTIRLYFHAGAENFRMVHSFVFDGDADKDFIRGLGVRFRVPLTDEPHNRHVRFASADGGLFTEAVRGITGLRRDPGAAVRAAQVAGRRTPEVSTWDTRVSTRLNLIPAWGDYSLSQLTADGYAIRKRTKAGRGWVHAAAGARAGGFGYVGGVSGGFAFGMRDFWQLHPTQLDIRGAAGESAEVTLWLWSPDAQPMDLRFYHDGMGMDTYPEQLEGLEITYEDYEPGFGNPYGVARTSELTFWALGATPSAERLAAQAAVVRSAPLLVTTPQWMRDAGVFGDWSPVDRSTPAKAQLEDRLDFLFGFYRDQVEQRRWYGFWNYGDVMHTYDNDRHEWRYDVGGYAWDNSELSTDLWLWYSYLRSGRADVFRMAEAMTRHTGEVDVYHIGKYADLGTRHGVQHWADSAKQLRISTAANRRFLYFLTADERIGDLMHDLVDADKTFLALDPLRKIRTEPYEPDPHALAIGLGTDWGALAAAWFTEWERGGDPVAKTKLLNTATAIGKLRNGFITGEGRYDLTTGTFATDTVAVSVSHLSSVFGLVEMCSEIIAAANLPEFERAWLQYCTLYNGTAEEQIAAVGQSFGSLNLKQAHSRLTAYAAAKKNDPALAARAWAELAKGEAGYPASSPWRSTKVTGPSVLNPVDEATWVSTNATAQYGLAAIQCLALVGDRMPAG
ncbi:Tat pathway signal sequence domain protein [Amycolatopsis sp. NPDC059657]|uniref:exo-rhamnogalacturonan lyase family protein n=1 Tax=Amycolatopsis sp. NPDC059657 TaxID=3346899 RepID=UPI00366D53A1